MTYCKISEVRHIFMLIIVHMYFSMRVFHYYAFTYHYSTYVFFTEGISLLRFHVSVTLAVA